MFKVGSIRRRARLSFGNFFVSLLCLRLFNISSIWSQDVFDPVECKAWFLSCAYLPLLWIDTSFKCFHRDISMVVGSVLSSSFYRFITILVPDLILPIFWQFLLRNGKFRVIVCFKTSKHSVQTADDNGKVTSKAL